MGYNILNMEEYSRQKREYNKKIDGYNVTEVTKKSSENERIKKDIQITYFSDNKKFGDSKVYKEVDVERIKKVNEKLFDYTFWNLNCKTMAAAIPLFTIINEIERIIYGC